MTLVGKTPLVTSILSLEGKTSAVTGNSTMRNVHILLCIVEIIVCRGHWLWIELPHITLSLLAIMLIMLKIFIIYCSYGLAKMLESSIHPYTIIETKISSNWNTGISRKQNGGCSWWTRSRLSLPFWLETSEIYTLGCL